MKRYIKAILALIFSATLIIATILQVRNFEDMQGLNAPEDHGWVAPEATVQLYGSPDVPSGKGQIRLLYQDWQKVVGSTYVPRRQSAPDCVGQSAAAGMDFRIAVQAAEGPYLPPPHNADASSIYGLSRVEIAGKSPNALPGSQVRWAMKALSQYGLLWQTNYLYAGYDLSIYDPRRSQTWGSSGLPNVLEGVSKLTPLMEYYQVTNYEQVRDALNAGYPVVVGCNVGFGRRTIFTFGNTKSTRDQSGFLRARGIWNHAQVFVGVDDKSSRKGVCCLNSWGSSWVSGPTKLNNPPGSYWIDAHTITDMVSQMDAFAIVHVNSPLNYKLTK